MEELKDGDIAYKTKEMTILIGDFFGVRKVVSKVFRVNCNSINKKHRTSPCLKVQCECGSISSVYINNLEKSISCKKCSWKRQEFGFKEVCGTYFGRIKSMAKQRGYEISITPEDIYNKYISQNKKCALTGLDIEFLVNGSQICTASVDRIDSNKHYTIDNIQILHKDVNIMKNKYNQDYFLNICKLITEKNND
jgi:hypothetical protein